MALQTDHVADRHQSRLLQLFLVTYVLTVCTGAIRKWLFPSVTALYFLQDLPILAAYVYAFRFKLYKSGPVAWGIAGISALLLGQSLIQFAVLNLQLKIAAVGYHAYLFYLPMLIIFPLAMDAHGRSRYIRWYLLSSIPMSVLAVLQSRASASSVLNRTTGAIGFGGLGVDIARVSGTFNFAAFYAIWLSYCFAFAVSEWLLPQYRRNIQNRAVLLASTLGSLLSLSVSGERGAVGSALIAMTGVVIVAGLLKNYRALLIVAVLVLSAPVIVGLASLVSPRMLVGFENRFTNTHNVNMTKGRILNMMVSFIPQASDPVGKGLGYGVDGSHAGEVGAYEYTYQLSETDLARNLLELGVVTGSIYVAWRMFFCIGLVLISLKLAVDNVSPHALPLSLIFFEQGYIADWTRNSSMSSTQAFMAACFILGAFYFRDYGIPNISEETPFATRYV